jgi:hypothetical protein
MAGCGEPIPDDERDRLAAGLAANLLPDRSAGQSAEGGPGRRRRAGGVASYPSSRLKTTRSRRRSNS